MRKIFIIIAMLTLSALCAEGRHYDRGYDDVPASPFIKKGTWTVGGTAKYSQHINDKFNFLVIGNINTDGYSVNVSPNLLYTFRDNMAAGLKFSYKRSMLDLESADLSLGELADMNASDCYQIQHKFTAYGVFRAYIPFGNSKRVAMFADLQLGGSFKQGKAYNAGGDQVFGQYGQSYSLELAVDPGLIAFLTDRLALEVNVGIFGVSYNWSNQLQNQVEHAHTQSTSAGFIVNLLSLGVGLSYSFL